MPAIRAISCRRLSNSSRRPAIALFNNTTAAPAVQQDGIVKAERSHYFDVGVNQIIVPGLTVGLDGYYKLATNLIDEGQFGAPIILTAFNYAKAYVAGGEFTVSYDQGPWSIYGNAAYSRAMGTNINSAQFNFAPDELAYIAQHYIHLDHDQTWTGSAGAAYTFNQGTKYQTRVSVDLRGAKRLARQHAHCAERRVAAGICGCQCEHRSKARPRASGKGRNFASMF